MTDPVQTQDPVHQEPGEDVFSGIFGGSEAVFDNTDIFKPINESVQEDKNIEEPIHFDEEAVNITKTPDSLVEDVFTLPEEEPIPEPIEEEVFTPIEEEPIPEPIEEETFTPIEEEEPIPEPIEEETIIQPIVEETPIEIDYPKGSSDLIISFYDLLHLVKHYEGLSEFSEHKELLGGNTDTIKLVYELQSDEETVTAYRKELNKESGEETLHTMTLSLNEDKDSLQLSLDDTALYDEKQDLIDNPNRKMQVSEKIHKFIFLLEEAVKDLEKKQKELEENKEQKKILQNVFRNF